MNKSRHDIHQNKNSKKTEWPKPNDLNTDSTTLDLIEFLLPFRLYWEMMRHPIDSAVMYYKDFLIPFFLFFRNLFNAQTKVINPKNNREIKIIKRPQPNSTLNKNRTVDVKFEFPKYISVKNNEGYITNKIALNVPSIYLPNGLFRLNLKDNSFALNLSLNDVICSTGLSASEIEAISKIHLSELNPAGVSLSEVPVDDLVNCDKEFLSSGIPGKILSIITGIKDIQGGVNNKSQVTKDIKTLLSKYNISHLLNELNYYSDKLKKALDGISQNLQKQLWKVYDKRLEIEIKIKDLKEECERLYPLVLGMPDPKYYNDEGYLKITTNIELSTDFLKRVKGQQKHIKDLISCCNNSVEERKINVSSVGSALAAIPLFQSILKNPADRISKCELSVDVKKLNYDGKKSLGEKVGQTVLSFIDGDVKCYDKYIHVKHSNNIGSYFEIASSHSLMDDLKDGFYLKVGSKVYKILSILPDRFFTRYGEEFKLVTDFEQIKNFYGTGDFDENVISQHFWSGGITEPNSYYNESYIIKWIEYFFIFTTMLSIQDAILDGDNYAIYASAFVLYGLSLMSHKYLVHKGDPKFLAGMVSLLCCLCSSEINASLKNKIINRDIDKKNPNSIVDSMLLKYVVEYSPASDKSIIDGLKKNDLYKMIVMNPFQFLYAVSHDSIGVQDPTKPKNAINAEGYKFPQLGMSMEDLFFGLLKLRSNSLSVSQVPNQGVGILQHEFYSRLKSFEDAMNIAFKSIFNSDFALRGAKRFIDCLNASTLAISKEDLKFMFNFSISTLNNYFDHVADFGLKAFPTTHDYADYGTKIINCLTNCGLLSKKAANQIITKNEVLASPVFSMYVWLCIVQENIKKGCCANATEINNDIEEYKDRLLNFVETKTQKENVDESEKHVSKIDIKNIQSIKESSNSAKIEGVEYVGERDGLLKTEIITEIKKEPYGIDLK